MNRDLAENYRLRSENTQLHQEIARLQSVVDRQPDIYEQCAKIAEQRFLDGQPMTAKEIARAIRRAAQEASK